MKTLAAGLAAHVLLSSTRLAWFIKIDRRDGLTIGLTSHDQSVTVAGLAYEPGFDPSSAVSSTGLTVDNLEAKGVLNSESITEADVDAGMWDFAEVHVFQANWTDPTLGTLKELRGWFGEFKFSGSNYTVELRNLAGALNVSIGELVGPGCAATVGDARCKVDLTDYTAAGEVTAVTDNRRFSTDLAAATVRLTPSSTGTPPLDYFDAGLLTWTAGVNAGRSMEVKTYALDGSIVLQLPMVDDVAPGDTFTVSAGCPKTRDACIAEFGNILNFRGFPDLPGADKVNRFGGQ
ncbi:MAG TPA: DUF2163 domain-containing protein [Burkholderiaceae bacterium]|nr:DUF2163 domain-containing protein [Burkholderiaceae bacterium]